MTGSRAPQRTGFTLVELLVVIVIIAILAAFLLPTLGRAIRNAKNAKIKTELQHLAQSIEEYKQKYGDYPPDCSNKQVVRRHIDRAWPRMPTAEKTALWAAMWFDPADDENNLSRIDPAEALVFWLGGFSTDSQRPFTGPGGPLSGSADRNEPLYNFDAGRLTRLLIAGVPGSNDEEILHGRPPAENDLFPVYLADGTDQPFVYFDSRTYMHNPINNTPMGNAVPPPVYPPLVYAGTTSIMGAAVPYRSDIARQATPTDPVPYQWAGHETFQIVFCGLDGDYGAVNLLKQYPSGQNYGLADRDNIASFSRGNTLGSDLP